MCKPNQSFRWLAQTADGFESLAALSYNIKLYIHLTTERSDETQKYYHHVITYTLQNEVRERFHIYTKTEIKIYFSHDSKSYGSSSSHLKYDLGGLFFPGESISAALNI